MRVTTISAAVLAWACLTLPAWAGSPAAQSPDKTFEGSTALSGLLPVHVDKAAGHIWLTLPPPGPDGVSARFLYANALRTGLGAAPTFLDRGRVGNTQILAFRRIGGKVAIVYENPRFRTTGTPADAGSPDFATSVVWMGDVTAATPDGTYSVDISSFLTTDTLGIAESLGQSGDAMGTGDPKQGAGRNFQLKGDLSVADPGSLKVFPDNIEVDALQTYASDTPGEEVANIAPQSQQVSFLVHHSLVRLPAPGFAPRIFDDRIGGFSTQVVDFSTPLGSDVVHDFANRFRLEKLDPSAARSRVKTPIVFYVDRNAPENIRKALMEGIGWWAQAFDEAGFIDAFQVKLLPEGADPLDVRYNMVNWVDRATRGWSYGQEIVDPRTGEIVKGMVVLGSLRTRQDIILYEGLVGTAKLGTGDPNDPAVIALERLRQLGAHEVGHALGFAHNFAASTQDRASVMDYPPPRIQLVDGAPDLSDAYGTGVGKWDKATVAWLYGAQSDTEAKQAAQATVRAGLRYVQDDNARAGNTGQPWGGLWDDGANPTAELTRLMGIRRVAIDRFDLNALTPGEPVAELKRKFVPLWLLHRYEVAAAAKAIGGVDFAYSVNGDGREAAHPVTPDAQRAALGALLDTLSADQVRVPARLVPLLSAARNGSDNRQYDIEVMDTPGSPVFDPLTAADVAVQVTLNALLAPDRLARINLQHVADPNALGVAELTDRLLAATMPGKESDALARRIAYQTLMNLAAVSRQAGTDPDVTAILKARVEATAHALVTRKGSPDEVDWAKNLSAILLDTDALKAAVGDGRFKPAVPPGEPIGSDDAWN
ncbi:MAG: zinc-dependent metalloprotease [Asticcacaulis sp.]|uniref:zinc-dependent metalloprotease n=1 Tax=Asticcacaulis sp. TaxID=1872648 RepID=UPI0039E4A9CE